MKPRVLFVGPTRYSLPLPDWLQKKFDALDQELDYHVLARGEDGNERFTLLADRWGPIFRASLPGHVARAMQRFRPQVVIAEDPPTAAAALLARRLVRSEARVVAEVHGDWRHSTRLYGSPARRLLSPVADAVASSAVRSADAVRALSSYTARLVEDVRRRPPEATFPTFSDLSAFEGPRVALPDRPTALFVGALELYKGVDTLAAAWPRVTEAVRGARLVVVGRGSRAGIVSRIGADHSPALAPTEVAARMDDSWVLVLPSRHEGFGRVVVESFARGRGVVAGRAGGILDLVHEGREGLLVEPGDPAGLAAALARVLSDRALAEGLGEAAAAAYPQWRSTAEDFAANVRAVVEAALH